VGDRLNNTTSAPIELSTGAGTPVTAAIYQLDGIVRRAPSLQLTADGIAARSTFMPQAKAAEEGVPA
jgi:NADH-quinone oxidoreductase subunit G